MSTQTTEERIFAYLEGGRIHSGIILVGNDRETKLSFAQKMAAFLIRKYPGNTKNIENIENRIAKNLHPDVITLNDEDEDIIKIKQVREVCHQMEVAPIEAGFKVCIINDCHKMNQASANAFLKSLEEPGPNRLFLLLTSQPGSLLPTIISRCVQFHFKPTTESVESSNARESGLPELLHLTIEQNDTQELLKALKDKDQIIKFIQFLQHWHRNYVIKSEIGSGPMSGLTSQQASEIFLASVELEGKLRSNANPSLLVDAFVRKYILRKNEQPTIY